MSKLVVLGGGNMAQAIVRGLIEKQVHPPQAFCITEKLSDKRDELRAMFPGCRIEDHNAPAIADAEQILFAVKPQNMPDVLAEIAPVSRSSQLYISICAGITSTRIEDGLTHAGHPAPRVVRVMPNTPALIGEGVAGICAGRHATTADLASARVIFEAIGIVREVPESLMDAVTGLTGSGPAYVFYLMEALIEAGVRMGFSPADSDAMVRQLLVGAAKLAASSDKTPAELRRAVTSPNGTTAAGVAVLDDRNVRDALVECVLAAERRGKELGRQG